MGHYDPFAPSGGPGLVAFFFILVFLLVIGVFLFVLVAGLRQWSQNNRSPRLTVGAVVTGKRTRTSTHRHGDRHTRHTSTWYYAAFQVESGDRMEFSVTGMEYGQLAEGDQGQLTFQGTRYLGFERTSTSIHIQKRSLL